MDGDEFDDRFQQMHNQEEDVSAPFPATPTYQADLRTQAGHLEIPDMSAALVPRRSQEGRGAEFSQTSGGDQFVSSSLQRMGREEREQLQIEFPHMSRSPSSSQSPSLLQTTASRVRDHQRTSQPEVLI